MSLAIKKHEQAETLTARSLGCQQYEPLWRAMQRFTEQRNEMTTDELWFTEHPPVFTLGLNASRDHVLAPGDIPVVQVDRGGQVTYHGPGQLMIYPLIDIKRRNLAVRDLVTALEATVVELTASFGIEAVAIPDAPGVYVAGQKLASVGLRVKRGASYHGMALNVDMEIEPFSRINPCGYRDLKVTDLRRLGVNEPLPAIALKVQQLLLSQLGISHRLIETGAAILPT